MLWLDTSTGTDGTLRQRNLSNTAWVVPQMAINWNGGTVGTPIVIAPTSGSPALTLKKVAAADGNILAGVDEGGKTVWRLYLGNTATDDMQFARYNDAGALIGNAVTISRATGVMTVADGLTVNTALTSNVNVNLTNHKIINLAAPTVATDAATKAYVDTAMASAGEVEEAPDDGTAYVRKECRVVPRERIYR